MTRAVLPHFVADPGAVSLANLLLDRGGEWGQLPEVIPDWDYNTDLHLRTTLTADAVRLLTSTSLDRHDDFRLCVSWRATDGKVGGRALLKDVVLDEPLELDFVLPGSQLGAIVDLSFRLVLGSVRPSPQPGQAHLPGSILWEQVTRIALLGAAARFPVLVVDFADYGLDPDASWTLDLPPDLSRQTLGSLLLLINARDTELVAAVSGAGEARPLLERCLQEDVACRLLDFAVECAEELAHGDWEDGSMGSMLTLLATRAEGGLEGLRALRAQNAARYQSLLTGEARRSGVGRSLP